MHFIDLCIYMPSLDGIPIGIKSKLAINSRNMFLPQTYKYPFTFAKIPHSL